MFYVVGAGVRLEQRRDLGDYSAVRVIEVGGLSRPERRLFCRRFPPVVRNDKITWSPRPRETPVDTEVFRGPDRLGEEPEGSTKT